MAAKLTKAQENFLTALEAGALPPAKHAGEGWAREMCRREGLAIYSYRDGWRITPAGRQALTGEPDDQ